MSPISIDFDPPPCRCKSRAASFNPRCWNATAPTSSVVKMISIHAPCDALYCFYPCGSRVNHSSRSSTAISTHSLAHCQRDHRLQTNPGRSFQSTRFRSTTVFLSRDPFVSIHKFRFIESLKTILGFDPPHSLEGEEGISWGISIRIPIEIASSRVDV